MQPPLSFCKSIETDLDKTLAPILREGWMPSSRPHRPRTSATKTFYCPSTAQFWTNPIGILKELLTFRAGLHPDAGGGDWRAIACKRTFTDRRPACTSLLTSLACSCG